MGRQERCYWRLWTAKAIFLVLEPHLQRPKWRLNSKGQNSGVNTGLPPDSVFSASTEEPQSKILMQQEIFRWKDNVYDISVVVKIKQNQRNKKSCV